MRRFALLVLLLTACDGSTDPDAGGARDGADPTDGGSVDAGSTDAGSTDAGSTDGGGSTAPCTEFANGVPNGNVASTELDELSGLAASRANPGLYYANNDSGDSARVFVLDETGAHIGQITLTGASHRDYEDIAVGPGPDGEPWVYVGDHGDNAARTGSGTPRASVVLYRFAEPTIDRGAAPVALALTPEAIEVSYPDAPRDCESLAVDPVTGDVYMLTKHDSGLSSLFVAAAPLTSPVTLELVTTVDIGGDVAPGARQATAMDLSPGGRRLLVRTYNRIHLWTRGPSEGWDAPLARPSTIVPSRTEGQGEAIAWTLDGRGYFTASEGSQPPVYFFGEADPSCDPI